MTDNIELSDCDKTIMNADEPMYGDLITEIELVEDPGTDDKVKESLTDLVSEPTVENTDLPTESETFVTTDVLTQDDASDFFTIDTKTDDFGNDMIIGEIDNEGIDFKNDTDITECHHEYESKKLIFEECGDIVEVVNSEEIVLEEIISTEVPQEDEKQDAVEPEIDKPDPNQDGIDPCFEIAAATEESARRSGLPYISKNIATNTNISLNRMHVMEDVEEGCDVSGGLPSSPGHAEQRPDPPKITIEVSTPTDETASNETEPTILPSKQIPSQNGLEHSPIADPLLLEHPEIKEEEKFFEKTEPPIDGPQSETVPESETSGKEPEITIEEHKVLEETKPNLSEDQSKAEEGKKENEDDNSSSSDSSQSTQSSKRKADDLEVGVSAAKKLRTQIQQEYANHDRILNDYIEASNCATIEEFQLQTEQLLAEIRTLNELAKEKEKEWNNIIHIKKIKEELLLRMQRKKHVLLINSGNKNDLDWDLDQMEDQPNPKNNNKQSESVVSSSPAGTTNSRSSKYSKSRNSLPKNVPTFDMNGQGEYRQGRQGPILDVRSIIADYRQRHPETVPRRGRRLKSVLNTGQNDNGGKINMSGNVMSMASLALGSGSQVRHGTGDISNELGLLLSTMDQMRADSSRPSSADSSMTSLLTSTSDTAMSFKDVLVQFARLSQGERQELQAQAAATLAAAVKPPPPPYPEVTLHAVPTAQTNQIQVPPTQNSSLLHGILTKTQPRADSKPTTFSPTLARLLTAPERASNNTAQAMYNAALNSGVSISDLLSSSTKSRNEITITPVGQFQYGQIIRHKDIERLEEEEAEDSADRLVIDEGSEMTNVDRSRTDNGSEDDVPQCQGCHQKSAQFVCAGCGNQWYCSRDCQVAAWDEHSEVCSG